MTNITFEHLNESHFSLLLKWLETPHVKKWWDQEVNYTIDLVRAKYSSYVEDYKQVGMVNKPIHAYIINVEQNPIGYIQIYNAYDFPRSEPLLDLPQNLGVFDIFIGEEKYLGQNLGSKAIVEFLNLHCSNYDHIFADPALENIAAIKCYEKAGFKKIIKQQTQDTVWMLKQQK